MLLSQVMDLHVLSITTSGSVDNCSVVYMWGWSESEGMQVKEMIWYNAELKNGGHFQSKDAHDPFQ